MEDPVAPGSVFIYPLKARVLARNGRNSLGKASANERGRPNSGGLFLFEY
jgi:hypothetical protein